MTWQVPLMVAVPVSSVRKREINYYGAGFVRTKKGSKLLWPIKNNGTVFFGMTKKEVFESFEDLEPHEILMMIRGRVCDDDRSSPGEEYMRIIVLF